MSPGVCIDSDHSGVTIALLGNTDLNIELDPHSPTSLFRPPSVVLVRSIGVHLAMLVARRHRELLSLGASIIPTSVLVVKYLLYEEWGLTARRESSWHQHNDCPPGLARRWGQRPECWSEVELEGETSCR